MLRALFHFLSRRDNRIHALYQWLKPYLPARSPMTSSISWEKSAAEVCKFVRRKKAFTFLKGFRIPVLAAETAPDEPGAPGQIVRFDGTAPIVKCGSGCVRVFRYSLDLPDSDAPEDLREFIRVSGLNADRFTTLPFQTNRESNEWELAVARWRSRNNPHEIPPGSPVETPLMTANRPFVRFLVDTLGLKPGDRIMDIGCGDGWTCRLFAELGLETWGIDLSPLSLAYAKHSLPNGHFLTCDLFDLPQKREWKKQFKLVFCRDLGVGQKIIDWTEPSWLDVGRGLVDLLTPDGTLYWIQMTDRSNRIDALGFSNPGVEVLRKYFGNGGHVAHVNVFDYISLYVRPSERWLKPPDHRTFQDPKLRIKALYAQLSHLMLRPPSERVLKCASEQKIARRIARQIGLEGLRIERSNEELPRTDKSLYLISADQDAYFESFLLPPLLSFR